MEPELLLEKMSFPSFETLDVDAGPVFGEETSAIKRSKKGGRPTVMTENALQKLKWAYLIDSSDREACHLAGISPQTLYNYQHKNPEFLEQKARWKMNTAVNATLTVAKAVETDANIAWKYLERKFPEEFGNYCKGCKEKIR